VRERERERERERSKDNTPIEIMVSNIRESKITSQFLSITGKEFIGRKFPMIQNSPMARQPFGGLGRLIFRGFTITHFRHTTFGRTPLDE
jgi:hypothetical protein